MAMELAERKGREGNRWFNERPSADEVVKWFAEAVELPAEMKHDRYVAGVTLIPGTEKTKEPAGFADNGAPLTTDVEHLVFTPYVKVETRVQFWTDLLELHAEDWLGVIEPIAPLKPTPTLPPGFSRYSVSDGDKVTNFLTCTMKVTVYKRSSVQWETLVNQRTGEKRRIRVGETIIDAPPATKIVPVKGRWGADVHAVEKAETGAVGRALGMAGMLVVPGTGVATAEDMRELAEQEGVSAAAREERPPAAEGRAALDAGTELSHDELVVQAERVIGQLKEKDEPTYTLFLAWCRENGFQGKVAQMKDGDIKTITKKAERELERLDAPAAPPTAELPGGGGQDA